MSASVITKKQMIRCGISNEDNISGWEKNMSTLKDFPPLLVYVTAKAYKLSDAVIIFHTR